MTRLFTPGPSSSSLIQSLTWCENHVEKGKPSYRSLDVRLKSFENSEYDDWAVNPVDLAMAGFYSTGVHDEVKCYSCLKELGNWDTSDTALGEHFRWSPSCPIVRHELLKLIKAHDHALSITEIVKLLNIPEDIVKDNPAQTENVIDYVRHLQNMVEKDKDVLENGCKVCLINPLNVVFIPCRHLACCNRCSDHLGKCCICNTPIESVIRVYIP